MTASQRKQVQDEQNLKVQDVQNQYALKIVLGESDTRMLRREHMILREIVGLADPSDQITVIALPAELPDFIF